MVSFNTLGAAVLLSAIAAPPALAHDRALNGTSRPQGYKIEGREIAAPPWSFACMNDQGPQQCNEPMWVYGSPDYLAKFKNAF